ncbi:MAG: amidohydrolase [Lachnospiraceae bacterium]|nr:amidohydrolase [Lachnospiraceae bacterium]
MNIRLYNAKILDLDESHTVRTGEVRISDGLIAEVIYDGEIRPEDRLFDREIDCKGNLLMRGFNDAHTHSAMTFLRSLADDKPTPKWLEEDIFPNEAKLAEDDIADFQRLSIMEYVSGGIVSAMDMYLRPDVTAEVFASAGMRAVIVSGLNNFTSSLSELEDQFERLNSFSPLVSFKAGIHAEYTTSREILEKLSGFVHEKKTGVYCHASETESEVAGCIERYGLPPVEFLDSLGLFDHGGGIYHGVHVTDEEIGILKEKGVYTVTNPASNCKLASGILPLKKLYDFGVKLAIGTDGPASNNCLDMFREMYLASVLCKIREKDAACIDASVILDMAVKGSAGCMGLEDSGLMKAGKPADIIMIDMNRPNMQPVNNIVKNLVYSGQTANIKMTMVSGRILYYNGEYDLGFDPEEIIRRCGERTDKIVSG